MALIGMQDVCWGFGDPPLLVDINFQIETGERICLLGRNGVGKSTLFKLISGDKFPDSGKVWRQQGVSVALLEQEVPTGFTGSIFDIIAQGLGEIGRALMEHSWICRELATATDPEKVKRREALQQILDASDGWSLFPIIENVLSRTGLDGNIRFSDLSAGLKRRTLFARALALDPDVFLLDEPTNHLDIDAIIWLETYILRHIKTLIFITHDRSFLKNIATRVLDLDRGRLTSYACNYDTYLNRKAANLQAEKNQDHQFDKKLFREEDWIRQGIKARRTRNEGRVRALMRMRAAYQARRKKIGDVNIQIASGERTGKLVIEAKSIGFSYENRPVITAFSTVILRGDKVGIIGPNGAGKTTLLKILLKDVKPQSGSVRHGIHLEVVYFDQLRGQLDEQKTVAENIGEGNNFIETNGRKRHVIGYLKDFLFSPERSRTPVYVLSGGEKNRLLLAKLFTRPANVLVLDEPTNDLDYETLELLEEVLLDYDGTLLLVSHDRTFLNNVVTSTIAFEGGGQVAQYPGGYDDWLDQRLKPSQSANLPADKKFTKTKDRKSGPEKKTKLSFKEKRELEALPRHIETLEGEQKELFATMSGAHFYKKDKTEMVAIKNRLDQVENEMASAYIRWEELEGRK
jgi:ATP-binding cassette subfamily F protein uup